MQLRSRMELTTWKGLPVALVGNYYLTTVKKRRLNESYRNVLYFLFFSKRSTEILHLWIIRWILSITDYEDGDEGGGGADGGVGGDMGRMGGGCSKDDIVIYQGQTGPLPDGIPSFTVQIINECGSDCSISDIHISCGWFSSARQVNPTVFRRIYYDDCLVNDGNALGPGQSLNFMYANTYPYPLSVSSVSC